MRRGKHWGVILLSLLAAGYFAAPCLAVDQLAVTTRTETSDDCITVTVQLQDYIDPQDEIRGLQIDVDTSSLDLAQLHVEAPRSLIEDGSAYSNTAVWDGERGILRLNYLRFDGTLPAPVWDVMEFTLRVDPEVAQAGSVTLPVTAKFQMASGLQTTRRTECEIEYEAQTEGYVNVTIRWGALEYTYSDGIWNPQTHSYENGGWSDNGTVRFCDGGKPGQPASYGTGIFCPGIVRDCGRLLCRWNTAARIFVSEPKSEPNGLAAPDRAAKKYI